MLPFYLDQNTSSYKKDISITKMENSKHIEVYTNLKSKIKYLEFKKSDLVTFNMLLPIHDIYRSNY